LGAGGLVEVPITWFRDGLGRIRPAQLCACSIGQFDHLLMGAWSRQWRVVTLLLHSFELVRRRSPERSQMIMHLHDRRLVQLCRLLAANSGKFISTTFGELATEDIVIDTQPPCLGSSLAGPFDAMSSRWRVEYDDRSGECRGIRTINAN
jgi:hypothetical protein